MVGLRVLLLVLLTGCAGNFFTPDQLEWRHSIDIENWDNCEAVYNHYGVPTFHINHSHSIRSVRRITTFDIRDDLMVNRCRGVLGKKYWIDYGLYGTVPEGIRDGKSDSNEGLEESSNKERPERSPDVQTRQVFEEGR